jgi:hypothetical protein
MDFQGAYRPSPPHHFPSIHEIHVIHGPKKRASRGATPFWGQRVGRGEGGARWAVRGVRMGGCRGGRALKLPDYGEVALGQEEGAHASTRLSSSQASVRASGAFTLEA